MQTRWLTNNYSMVKATKTTPHKEKKNAKTICNSIHADITILDGRSSERYQSLNEKKAAGIYDMFWEQITNFGPTTLRGILEMMHSLGDLPNEPARWRSLLCVCVCMSCEFSFFV